MLYLGQTRTSRLLLPGARVLYSYCIDNPPCCGYGDPILVSCEDGCAEWTLPVNLWATLDPGPGVLGMHSIPMKPLAWAEFGIADVLYSSFGGLGDYWVSRGSDLSSVTWDSALAGGPVTGTKFAKFLKRVDDPLTDHIYWYYVSTYLTAGCTLSGVPATTWAQLAFSWAVWIVSKELPSGTITRTVYGTGSYHESDLLGRDGSGNCTGLLPTTIIATPSGDPIYVTA